jgi:hypothetical protein
MRNLADAAGVYADICRKAFNLGVLKQPAPDTIRANAFTLLDLYRRLEADPVALERGALAGRHSIDSVPDKCVLHTEFGTLRFMADENMSPLHIYIQNDDQWQSHRFSPDMVVRMTYVLSEGITQ